MSFQEDLSHKVDQQIDIVALARLAAKTFYLYFREVFIYFLHRNVFLEFCETRNQKFVRHFRDSKINFLGDILIFIHFKHKKYYLILGDIFSSNLNNLGNCSLGLKKA